MEVLYSNVLERNRRMDMTQMTVRMTEKEIQDY